ncbi:MAG: nucleoside monophosphate kinase [Patescibacteria group bacterium]|jgi:adenylate kinase
MSERTVYSFLGLPGSGKGTQAEIMAKKMKVTVFGMGNLIRKELENADFSDPFYKEMKERYDKGIPQPDEIAVDIIKKNIDGIEGDIVLDNFPFTKNQSDLFFEMCKDLGIDKPVCVWIKIEPESALNRILNRKVCSKCGKNFIGGTATICDACGGSLISRADDKAEVVENRISIYKPRIDDVVEEFKNQAILIEINGEQTIPEVEKEIEEKVINAEIK